MAPKGKFPGCSTAWSAYEWDQRVFWISSRVDVFGEREYDYRYPETPTQQQNTPRSPGPTVLNGMYSMYKLIQTPCSRIPIFEGPTACYPSTDTSVPNVYETTYPKDPEYQTKYHATQLYAGAMEFGERQEYSQA
jgi:hypothetical protein